MEVRERYVGRLLKEPAVFGLTEAKFIHAPQIFTSRAIRLRCRYTCCQAHQSATVPPMSPSAEETRAVLDEYRFGLVLRREEPLSDKDIREVWREFAGVILGLEGECIVRGYPRAFAIAIGTCLYQHSDDTLRPCDYPMKSRPTLEATGIELHDTLEMVQWQDHVVREAGDPLQLFSVLLLD